MGVSKHGNLLINLLTGSRLVLALAVAMITPWAGSHRWAIMTATLLVLAIEVSDLADGYLARRHNVVSQFGKVFDPFADSVARLTVFWSLATVRRALGFVPLVMAVRDLSVAYLRIVMIRRGWDAGARYTGKLKAAVQGFCALVLVSGPLYWGPAEPYLVYALSFAVVGICVGSLADYAWATLRPSQVT